MRGEIILNLVITLTVAVTVSAAGRPKNADLRVPTITLPPSQNASASGLFKMEVPESDTMFSALFNGPPAEFTAKLYVDPTVTNFTVGVRSTETDILITHGNVLIIPCMVSNETSADLQTLVMVTDKSSQSLDSNPGYTVEYSQNVTSHHINMTCYDLSVNVSSVYLGYSVLEFTAKYSVESSPEEERTKLISEVAVKCLRFMRRIDVVFQILIYLMVSVATLGMGNGMDIPTIKKHLKTPKAPLIALISQYTFMPLLSYAVIYIMGYKGGWALGMFMMGCSPGGGSSNMYSKLLNGDMSLSITMTTISTFASLGMVPFWVYTLGQTIPADEAVGRIKIPFLSILRSLAFLIIPILIGVLIRHKLPKVSRFIKKGLKVFFIILILFFFTVGIYSNLYIYQSFRANIVFSGALLPWGGYIFGGLSAWICRLEWKLIKTVSLETGMQNVGLAILVLQGSLPKPDSDLAIIPPVAAMLMTSLPFYIATPIYLIRQRILKRREEREKLASEENADTKLNEMGSQEEETGSDITAEAPPTSNIDKFHQNGTVEEKQLLNSAEKDIP